MKTLNTALKLTAIAAVALTLVACGGGGGGGGGSVADPVIADPVTIEYLNGKFGGSSITLGQKDLNIDGAAKYNKSDWSHEDVQSAYNQGWTGKGIGIMVFDDFSTNFENGTATHGSVVQDVAQKTAQGAYVFGRNHQIDGSFVNTTGGNAPSRFTNILNLSLGVDETQVRNLGLTVTVNDVLNAPLYTSNNGTDWTLGKIAATGVLITKAAGNGNQYSDQGTNIDNDLMNRGLKSLPNVIFVGNANAAPNVSNEPSGYTAPGLDKTYQDKFLVVNAPWTDENGRLSATCVAPAACGTGSSFAAPVVAGYGAVIMQKFSGINGSQTAQILLNTAKKDFGGYDAAIHGQGEASLSRALSPVGRLR